MKLLVICQHYWPEPYRLADLCEELVQRGHTVHVITGVPNYPKGEIYAEYRHGKGRAQVRNGVRITRTFTIGRRNNIFFRLLNYFSFSISSSLHALRLREEYDVVFAQQASPVMMANAALTYARKHGIKSLLYCMDLWPTSLKVGGMSESSPIYWLFKQISQKIYRGFDKIFVSSEGFSGYLTREFDIDREKICYLPQYADHVFPLKQHTRGQTVHLVFAGNIGVAQSVPTILRAAALLQGCYDICWHIAGDGSALEECRHLAAELDLDCVQFHGYLSGAALQALYDQADAMLISLVPDEDISLTLPMKIMSYMAAGKPIIASANGEIARVIRQADCGYTAPAESPEQLADAVRSFLRENRDEALGRNALQYYSKHFSRENYMDQLERAVFELQTGGTRSESADYQFSMR